MDLRFVRYAYVAILAVWLLTPFIRHDPAQDAIPLSTAGTLLAHHADAIYLPAHARTTIDTAPAFRAVACRSYPTAAACRVQAVPFISSPLALPIVAPLAWLGTHAAFAVRLLGALLLAGGMMLLWGRYALVAPRAPLYLLLAAVAATPMAVTAIAMGQTTPILFAAACLSVAQRRRPGVAVALVLLLAAAISFKLFPVVLLAVLARQGRWRLVAAVGVALAVLAGLAVALVPTSVFGQFLESSRFLGAHAASVQNNGSLESALWHLGVRGALVNVLPWVVRIGLVVALVRMLRPSTDPDVVWPFAWFASLLLFPQVWDHYLLLVIPAAFAVMAHRADRAERLWVAPAICALVLVPTSLVNHGSSVLQLVVLAGAVGALAYWLPRPSTDEAGASTRPDGHGEAAATPGIAPVSRTTAPA